MRSQSPNDKDLGEQELLQRREKYLPFSFSVTTPVFYTSNVALVHRGEQDDVLFAPAISAAYQPRLTQNLFARDRRDAAIFSLRPIFGIGLRQYGCDRGPDLLHSATP